MSFSWQTDNQPEGWGEPPPPTKPPPRPWQKPRLLAVLCLLLVVVGTAVYSSWQSLQRHLSQREEAIRAELRTSFTLWEQAARTNDSELLQTILSGTDAPWGRTQQRLAQDGYLWQRPFSSWHSTPNLSPETPLITLAPNLREAELTFTRTHTLTHSSQLSQTIQLQETLLFRQGRERWLLSAPDAKFWGEEESLQGDYLTLLYHGRETTPAHQLHHYLEEKIGQYCAQIQPTCPKDSQLTLRLASDPATLPTIFNPAETSLGYSDQYQTIELPTLGLIGTPLDEPSREALFGQYATHLLTGLNRRLIIGTRLGQVPFDHVLWQAQLAALELPTYGDPLPPPPTLYATLGEYEALWRMTSLPPNASQAILPHLAQLLPFVQSLNPAATPLTMQQALNTPSFMRWLASVTEQEEATLTRAWLRYVWAQQGTTKPPSEDEWSGQVIKLLCTQENSMSLLTYSWLDEQWVEEQTWGGVNRFRYDLTPLPDDTGYALATSARRNGGVWRLQVGEHHFSNETDPDPLRYTGESDPTGRYLLLQSDNPMLEVVRYSLLDQMSCQNGENCSLLPLAGPLVWSPSGEQVIMAGFDGLSLFQVTEPLSETLSLTAGGEWIGRGVEPFWVDEGMYGFRREVRGRNDTATATGWELVLGELATGRKLVHRVEDLAGLVAPTAVLLYATARDGWLYLLVGDGENDYLVRRDVAGENTAVLHHHPANTPIHRLHFSPDGRWLGIISHPQPETEQAYPTIQYTLLDLANPAADSGQNPPPSWHISLPPQQVEDPSQWQPDWSADGRWLLLTGREYLHLLQPESGGAWRTIHDYDACQDAHWLAP
jgi:hypothetical protein